MLNERIEIECCEGEGIGNRFLRFCVDWFARYLGIEQSDQFNFSGKVALLTQPFQRVQMY